VRRFPELARELKVPHMGWNRIELQRAHPLFEGIPAENEFYFVHSYYLEPERGEHVLATTRHGIQFASAFAVGNFAAVQFHPEKSGPFGLDILARFASWAPAAAAPRLAC
jgi:glutamine amidotransferase